MKGLALCSLVLLTACVPLYDWRPAKANATSVVGPDGTAWWSINCVDSETHCLVKASSLCPSGYDMGQQGAHQNAWFNRFGNNVTSGTTYQYHILLRCKIPIVKPTPPIVQPIRLPTVEEADLDTPAPKKKPKFDPDAD